MLTGEVVLKKFKAVLYPKTLTDVVDYLKYKIDDVSESLLAKDVRIADLENKRRMDSGFRKQKTYG